MAVTPSNMLELGTPAPHFKLTDAVSGNILSLSDIKGELDAAHEAGLKTCWLIREKDTDVTAKEAGNSAHRPAQSFNDIQI